MERRGTLGRGRFTVALLAAIAMSACEVPSAGPGELVTPVVLTPNGSGSYGPDVAHAFDLYLPAPPATPYKRREVKPGTIIWIHGGAWVGGSRAEDTIADEIERQVAAGWAVMSIDYRLAPDHVLPAAVEDVKRAVRFAKANKAALGLPPGPIALAGHSAGAHLALLAASSAGFLEPTDLGPELAAVDSRVAGAFAVSGPTDLAGWALSDVSRVVELLTVRLTAAELVETISGCPLVVAAEDLACPPDAFRVLDATAYLDPGDPPVYLVYGVGDPLVDIEIGRATRDAWIAGTGRSNSVWYDELEDGTHDGIGMNALAVDAFFLTLRAR